jgi:hypothetical protein
MFVFRQFVAMPADERRIPFLPGSTHLRASYAEMEQLLLGDEDEGDDDDDEDGDDYDDVREEDAGRSTKSSARGDYPRHRSIGGKAEDDDDDELVMANSFVTSSNMAALTLGVGGEGASTQPDERFIRLRTMAIKAGDATARVLCGVLKPEGYVDSALPSYGVDDGRELPTGSPLSLRGMTPVRSTTTVQYREYLSQTGSVERPRRLLEQLLTSSGLMNALAWDIYTIPDVNNLDIYSTASGKIFISEAMIRSMPTDEALAAVIAHEVGHVVAGHRAARVSSLWRHLEPSAMKVRSRLRRVRASALRPVAQRMVAVLDRLEQDPPTYWRVLTPTLLEKLSSVALFHQTMWQKNIPYHWTEMYQADRIALKLLSDAGIRMGHYQIWFNLRQHSPLHHVEEFKQPLAGAQPETDDVFDRLRLRPVLLALDRARPAPLVEKSHPSYTGRRKAIKRRLREVARIAELEEDYKSVVAARERSTQLPSPWWAVPFDVLSLVLPGTWNDSLRQFVGVPVPPRPIRVETLPSVDRTAETDRLKLQVQSTLAVRRDSSSSDKSLSASEPTPSVAMPSAIVAVPQPMAQSSLSASTEISATPEDINIQDDEYEYYDDDDDAELEDDDTKEPPQQRR